MFFKKQRHFPKEIKDEYNSVVIKNTRWVAISFPRDLPNPGIEPRSPTLQADSLLSEPPGKPPRNI